MNARHFCTILAIVVASVSAQDCFWSAANLDGGATQGDISNTDFVVGDTGSLFLYYSNANSDLGTSSNAGYIWVIQILNGIHFTSAAQLFLLNPTA